MKMKIKIILFCLMAFVGSCKEEDPGPKIGCQTGIRDGVRKLMRCCTYEEHMAGNNVAAGGVTYFTNYTEQQWEPAKNCEACQDKYW